MAELKCPLRSNLFFTKKCLKEKCGWYVVLYKWVKNENGQDKRVEDGKCGLPYATVLLCEALNLVKK